MRFLAMTAIDGRADDISLKSLGRTLNSQCVTTPGWRIFADSILAARQLADGMVLLGKTFSRGPGGARAEPYACDISPDEDDTRIAKLLREAWGCYLAFGQHRDGRPYCLRDPTGGVPAFHTTASGRLFIGSGVDILHAAAATAAAIDWDALAHQFLFDQPPGPRTCIENVLELTPGAALTFGGHIPTEHQHWLPAHFADAATPAAAKPAVDRLREIIVACVGSWAGSSQRPLIELSGGLDSSIVAAAISLSGKQAGAVTLVTPGRDGDERRLARLVADRLGMPLFEGERDAARVDLHRPIAAHLPRPGVRGFTQESDRLIGSVARDYEADALFSGGGGDSLFCMLGTAAPLADHIRAGCHPASLLRTACDTADACQGTIWSVAAECLRPAVPAWRDVRKGRARLMSRDIFGAGLPALSPQLAGIDRLPPGRRAHIEGIVGMGRHLVGMGRATALPLVFPLMSQPVIETCLALPSWLWVENGHDRAIARHAFADLLPHDVVFRRSKGRLDAFGHHLFDRHRETLRALLLDGRLAAAGMLDRAEVERQLATTAPARTTAYFLLLELADMEAWIDGIVSRNWAFH